ncbi:MAG: DUF6913 domain-containing protein [Candidatus Limimorpha sp.]
MLDKIRNRILKRSIEKFIKGKAVAKLPDLQRISSVIIILEESEKQLIRSIESNMKQLFGIAYCRFVVLSNQISDTVLQSDLHYEITPKDFGVFSVLKKEKQEYVRRLPATFLLVNMASEHLDISDYLSTLPRANFRVCFHESPHVGIYDLVIDNSKNASRVNDVQVLYQYLNALTGGKEPMER